ncbi:MULTISPECIES: ECF transporter S component [Carboxydothermus]|uniref:Membrane protein n=2 Tax=Carboxydothermus TaxID=129957 RepID=A0ABX2R979_9THEO|nr:MULTISPECIES: ECF transporter S component [Carboxydothermus]ABB13964.1 putative membrane protein [Carboxydothermus hydrogenoformans Z-2901]NYE56653.1 putative membrane protein [Carboxydothermus ferrireducens DSM 11255]
MNIRTLTTLAILIALSAVGAFIKIPSPTGTVALDSLPGYFAALYLSPGLGALVAALGHLLSAATAGFPLTLPLHLLVALEMAIFAAVFGVLGKRNVIVGIVVATLLNGVIAPLSFAIMPKFGMAFFTAMVVPLLVASFVNILLAGLTARALRGKTER